MLWSSLLLFALLPLNYGHLVDKYPEDINWPQARLQQNLSGGAAAGTLHLSSVASNGYTVLENSRFPSHRVRVKKTPFCDSTVNVYTGYLDVDAGAKHLFFYFFESRRDPDKDDVMMWINGGICTTQSMNVSNEGCYVYPPGPGCSSAMGLLMELGPCSIDMTKSSPNGTVWNPFSWNQEANIFFLDQPVGVGFSYADYGETIETTEDAAKNVQAFITIFFETFSQFTGRRLHLAGESYGGRYLPVFASEIYDQNQIAKSEGRSTLNLQSVLIGNGITDISTLYLGRYEVECGRASLDIPFQSISACVRMKLSLPRCQKRLYKSCIDHFDAIDCRAAVAFCDNELSTSMWNTGEQRTFSISAVPNVQPGRNVYDISKPCEGNLCYRENDVIAEYLDLPEIRELLGVENSENFSACSDMVGRNFNSHLDKWGTHTQDYVANLLDRGVRILIYAGTYDWQCNWVANKLWVDKLSWSQSDVYQQESWREWTVDGKTVGEVKQTDLLTFVTIREAGHMVPHDKPTEALAMVSRWLTGAMM